MKILKKIIQTIIFEEFLVLKETDGRIAGVGPVGGGWSEEPISSQATEFYASKLASPLDKIDKAIAELSSIIIDLEERNQTLGNMVQLKDKIIEDRDQLLYLLKTPDMW